MQRHDVEGQRPDPDDKSRDRRRTTVWLLIAIAGLLAAIAINLVKGEDTLNRLLVLALLAVLAIGAVAFLRSGSENSSQPLVPMKVPQPG